MDKLLSYGDKLDVLRQHVPAACVDLVYIAPPFNSNANYNVLFAERDGSRSAAQIQTFGDTWRWDQAPARAEAGERTVSTDEMTGVQALERAHPGLPPQPDRVERREYEYIRHGTLSFIVDFDVATGQVVTPSYGATRTEGDYAAHILRTVDAHSGLDLDLGAPTPAGRPCKRGVLRSRATRAAFLRDPDHRLVFHYTPNHASWMNQVKTWLGILVPKIIRRGNFTSQDDLRTKVLAFKESAARDRGYGAGRLGLVREEWDGANMSPLPRGRAARLRDRPALGAGARPAGDHAPAARPPTGPQRRAVDPDPDLPGSRRGRPADRRSGSRLSPDSVGRGGHHGRPPPPDESVDAPPGERCGGALPGESPADRRLPHPAAVPGR